MPLPTAPRLLAIVYCITLAALGALPASADVDDARDPSAILSASPHSPAAIDVLDGLRTEMRRARAAGEWHAYLTAAERQAQLLNGSPRSRLEVARAQVHLGSLNAALDELRAVVHMGQSSELFDTLPDLAPLRGTPAFAVIRDKGTVNRRPIARSSLAFRLKDRKLLPEDIEYDPGTQRFFISSVLRKRVVTATTQGDLADFALSPDGWPILALKIDHAQQVLWASEVAVEGFDGVDPSAQGRSALLCFELRSGKLMRRIEGPRPSALGDMALTSDGTVIISDGQHGGIYRVRRADEHMERIDGGDFISPQTVTMAADGAHIIVPDYLRGLALLEMETKQVIWLSTQGRFALNGIDGLYRVGSRLVAVQNGVYPERVAIFSMDPTGTSVVAEDIIERSTPTLGDPTHGVMVDDSFYYIANSGWDALDDNGKVKPGITLTEPLVMKFTPSAQEPEPAGNSLRSSRDRSR